MRVLGPCDLPFSDLNRANRVRLKTTPREARLEIFDYFLGLPKRPFIEGVHREKFTTPPSGFKVARGRKFSSFGGPKTDPPPGPSPKREKIFRKILMSFFDERGPCQNQMVGRHGSPVNPNPNPNPNPALIFSILFDASFFSAH